MHQLSVTPSAKRSLKKLPSKVRKDLVDVADILKTNPYAGEKLSGSLHFLYSLHFKSSNVEYRVAYTIHHVEKNVVIHFADVRENFYKKLRRLFK